LVIGVHAGLIDTDITSSFPGEKTPPEEIAARIIDAIETDRPEVLADNTARAVKAGFSKEPSNYLGG
jgi:hypothetical protein